MSDLRIKVQRNIPKVNTNSRKKRFKKRLYIYVPIVLFVILLFTTLIIGLKNTKDHTETIKQIESTVDPYFFMSETSAPTKTPQPKQEAMSELIGWIQTSQYGSTVNVRTEPDADSDAVTKINDRSEVKIVAVTDEQPDGHKWYKISHDDIVGFVRGDFIALTKPSPIPDVIIGCDVIDEITGKAMYSKLDYVSRVAGNVVQDITLATSDNFMGKVMYSSNVAMIQKSTGEKLKKAARIFEEKGYKLVLWDAYRPYQVTLDMSKSINDSYLAADPKKGSKLNRGAAVDVTLMINGEYIDMPTDDRIMDVNKSTRKRTMTDKQKANLKLLTDIMVECGFEPYDYAWWHFNDNDWEQYPVMDFPLSMFE